MKKAIWFRILRWFQIVFFSFLSLAALHIGREFVPRSFSNHLGRAEYFWPTFFVGFVVLVYLNSIVGFRFGQIRNLFKYPSFLVSVLMATVVIDSCFNTEMPHVGFVTVTFLESLIVAGLIRLAIQVSFVSEISGAQNSPSLNNPSGEEIVRWAQREAPLINSGGDLLRFNFRVDRIVTCLKNEEKSTVAVVGEYGSGKTTLTHFVKGHAERVGGTSLQFVWVSCWGFDNSAAAQEAVLTQIVDRLADGVDCFALQGMPSRFTETLSGTSHYLESLFRFVTVNDPDGQLGKLSPILSALNTRLVVVLEDTDRKSPKFDLSSIEGLLNRFRNIPEVSFVITAGLEAKIDFVRLCEHIEFIPDLDAKTVIRVLNVVRNFSTKQFPGDIDAVNRQDLRDLGFSPMMGKYGFWEANLVKLINTPRKLKATVRRFSSAWQLLHGEVDVDELLIATCLRICAPGVFSFLMRRSLEFPKSDVGKKDESEATKVLVARLKDEWNELKGQGFDLTAAANLLQVLDSNAKCLFGENVYRSTNLVQQFRSERTVYRDRIFNERLIESEVSDQLVLREMFDAKKTGRWKNIAEQLERSEDFREVFNLFSRFLLGTKWARSDLQNVIREVFGVLREKYGPKASRDCEIFSDIIQWNNKAFDTLEELYEAAYANFKECIPNSLQLGLDIFHSFIASQGSENNIKIYEERAMLLFREIFALGTPQVFVDALDESRPATLHELLQFGWNSNHSSSIIWKKWRWLGPILFEALKIDFEKLAPQIAFALGLTLDSSELSKDFTLNENVLDGVFGDLAELVMLELAKPLKMNSSMVDFMVRLKGTDFSLTHIRVQKWLEKKGLK